MSGTSNHVCRVDSHGTNDIQTVKNMYPNISKTIAMVKKDLPAERELIEKFENKINKKFEEKINKLCEPQECQGVENLKRIYKLNAPQKFQELEDFNYILACFFLSDKIDLEEFITKFTTGPWIGIGLNFWKFDDIFSNVFNASGDKSKSLKTSLELLVEEKIDLEKIRNLLIENYLISLGSIKIPHIRTDEKRRNIDLIFFGGGNKDLLKGFRNEEEKTQDMTEYIASLLNCLSSEREILETIIKNARILKTFIKIFYECLYSFIDNKDAGSRNYIIALFNSKNIAFSKRRDKVFFEKQGSIIIERLKVLIRYSNNEDWMQFVEDLEKNLDVAK